MGMTCEGCRAATATITKLRSQIRRMRKPKRKLYKWGVNKVVNARVDRLVSQLNRVAEEGGLSRQTSPATEAARPSAPAGPPVWGADVAVQSPNIGAFDSASISPLQSNPQPTSWTGQMAFDRPPITMHFGALWALRSDAILQNNGRSARFGQKLAGFEQRRTGEWLPIWRDVRIETLGNLEAYPIDQRPDVYYIREPFLDAPAGELTLAYRWNPGEMQFNGFRLHLQ